MSRFHNTTRWVRLSREVKERAGYRCQSPGCGKPGRIETDHVLPVAFGGEPWDPANLQALCRNCHFRKTAKERRINKLQTTASKKWDALVDKLRD